MAVTQEDQLLGVVESAPLPRSVSLDLPQTTHGDSKQPQDDLSLAYISRMLMEDDIVDKFVCQYPDQPKLLQAEQHFARILSSAATTSYEAQESSAPDALASALLPSEVHDPAFFSSGTVELSSTLFPV